MKTKKIIMLLVILLMAGLTSGLFANPIGSEKAKKIAKNFYFERGQQVLENLEFDNIELQLYLTKKCSEQSIYYVFNVNDNLGFVVISADDDAYPVIAYSFNVNYDNSNLSPAHVGMMNNYEEQIVEIQTKKLKADNIIRNEWERLQKPNYAVKNIRSVDPLLTTTWNQNMYYNTDCPEDEAGDDGHVRVGCVATAMVQIMKYHEYPVQGTGSHSYTHPVYGTISADFGNSTYDWASMPNNATDYNSSLALIGFHGGVSVDMNYGPNASGASSSDIAYAFINFFNYKQTAQRLIKSNYSISEWEDILVTELDNNRPIEYYGSNDQSGHAFVCDGYQTSSYFHFNWGWGGGGDGYYYLDDMQPGGSSWNDNQGAIVGIEPDLNGKELSLQTHNGGEIIQAGQVSQIQWNSTGVSNIRIEYTADNGQNWSEIISSTSATTGTYNWTVPNISSNECKIKLIDVTDINVYDISDDVFIIGIEPYPALQFDGISDYTQVSDFAYPATDLTIEAWIKPDQFDGTMEIIFGINPDNYNTIQFRINEDGSLIYGESPEWTYVLTSASCIVLNEWNHVAVVRENGLCKLYVNGNQLAEGIVNEGVNPTIIGMGGRTTNMDRFFSGIMVDVRMWNIARSQSELQGNMNKFLEGNEDGLIGYWRMDEGSGQTVFDLSNSGYDLQLGSTSNTDINDPEWITTFWPFIIPLSANFSADITSGNAPLTVNFTDLSTGNATSWEWDFDNDGTIDSYVQNPEWIYADPGIYAVSLSVGDGTNTVTEIKTDFITVFVLPGEPSNPSPEAGATNIPIYTNLNWVNGNNIETIDLYFGTNNPPTDLVLNNVTAVNFYDPDDLNTQTTYYWQLICKNSFGSTEGQVWSFTTGLETGIYNNQIINDLFIIYPNPAGDKFYIETKDIESHQITIKILNISGKIIYTKTISTNTIVPIDTDNIEKGIYFIQLRNEKYVQTKKLIVK